MDNEMNRKELKDQELRGVNGGEQDQWDTYTCVKVMPENTDIQVYAKRDVTNLKIVDFFDRNQVLARCDALKEGQTWKAPVRKDPSRTYALQVTCILLSGEEYTYTWTIRY